MKIILKIEDIQYLNLFAKVTGIKALCCFHYNSTVIFLIPQELIKKAVGKNGEKIQVLERKIRRKIKIIRKPHGIQEIDSFIKSVIFPYEIKRTMIENNTLYIVSTPHSKAAIIGKNKKRLNELSDILEKVFGIKQVIVK